MTSLTPVISSDYNSLAAIVAHNHSYVPIINDERVLYATAVYDVNTPSQTGQTGATYINDTTVHSNANGWYAVQFLANTKFAGLTSNWTGNSASGDTFDKNFTVYGRFTGIQLESGKILAYSL